MATAPDPTSRSGAEARLALPKYADVCAAAERLAGRAVRTPLLELDKAAIIRRGQDLGAPLHLTWSCYDRQDRPCQRCHSCHLRARGVAAVGSTDPIAASKD